MRRPQSWKRPPSATNAGVASADGRGALRATGGASGPGSSHLGYLEALLQAELEDREQREDADDAGRRALESARDRWPQHFQPNCGSSPRMVLATSSSRAPEPLAVSSATGAFGLMIRTSFLTRSRAPSERPPSRVNMACQS